MIKETTMTKKQIYMIESCSGGTGKTALAKRIALGLLNKRPVLYIDLNLFGPPSWLIDEKGFRPIYDKEKRIPVDLLDEYLYRFTRGNGSIIEGAIRNGLDISKANLVISNLYKNSNNFDDLLVNNLFDDLNSYWVTELIIDHIIKVALHCYDDVCIILDCQGGYNQINSSIEEKLLAYFPDITTICLVKSLNNRDDECCIKVKDRLLKRALDYKTVYDLIDNDYKDSENVLSDNNRKKILYNMADDEDYLNAWCNGVDLNSLVVAKTLPEWYTTSTQ